MNEFKIDLKRKLSLYMAIVMVIGLLAPFAVPPVRVYANVPIPGGGLPNTPIISARGGALLATFGATFAPAPARPALHTAGTTITPEGAVMMNWPLVFNSDDDVGGMDLLRFRGGDGRKHELTVTRILAVEGPGLMVNYDIYTRRPDGNGYIHISDPLRTVAQAGSFQISAGGAGWESASAFFTNNRNAPVVDDEPELTRLNRVNDRMRFDPDDAGAAARGFTLTHPQYHPDNLHWDDNRNDMDFPAAHYQRLSPSFNIGEGYGYSFRFGGIEAHFRWENGQFLLYILDILTPGNIHEFTLERYGLESATRGSGLEYFLSNDANLLVSDAGRVTQPDTGFTGNAVYVFSGIDRGTLNAIPYSQNRVGGALVDHTRLDMLDRAQDRQNRIIDTNLVAPFPAYNTGRLDMLANPPPSLTPAMQDLGLDVRFNLPTLFNEAAGGFIDPILASGAALSHPIGRAMHVRMTVAVGDGPQTAEDFTLEFPLYQAAQIPHYSPGVNNGWGELSVPPVIGRTGNVYDENGDLIIGPITFRDASLLTRQGETAADRVRMKVGGLRPSIAYQSAQLDLRTDDTVTNFLSFPNSQVAFVDDPFFTFLNFGFTQRDGGRFIQVEPYNLAVGRVRTGYYMITTDPPLGQAPQVATAATTALYFPLPRIAGAVGAREIFISHSQTDPLDFPPRIHSQIVWWAPDGDPSIDIPRNFSLPNDHIFHRPMQDDEHAGYLYYRAMWNIASVRTLTALLEPPTTELRLTYILGHSVSPETQLTNPSHRDYMRVDMVIRRDPASTTSPPALQIMFLESSRFSEGTNYPDLIEGRHPIVNVGEWLPLEARPDPSVGENYFFVELDIQTNSVRRFRYPPPPQEYRRDFHFPGIYFMNVRLENWYSREASGQWERQGESTAWSLFDYMVVNDFSDLAPPPPSNLTMEAGPNPPDPDFTQPYLNVSYGIPGSAIMTYLNTLPPLEVQITTSLYIGQFEDAIMDNYFRGPIAADADTGRPLAPEYRGVTATGAAPRTHGRAVREIAFDTLTTEFNNERTEIDMAALQPYLRGERGGGSGVVRISGIPLIRSASVTPSALGTIINFEYGQYTMGESFAETYRVLNLPNDFAIHLRLTNMEENTAFFAFADLEVEKFSVEDTPVGPIWTRRPDPNPVISDLTGVVTDTTVGFPDEPPGPGDVPPPAPSNVGVRDVEQTAASVYWDPIPLTQAQIDAGTRIEWELVRLQDAVRLTEAQMLNNDPNFAEVFAALTNSPDRKGWITSRQALTLLPGNRLILQPNEGDEYHYFPSEVELRDMTLHPNNLYFYYVRTVRIDRVWSPQLRDYVEVRSASVWVEVSVTTTPVRAPINLRQEDPLERDDFCGMTMVAVSWEHEIMSDILAGMGTLFTFRYQIRESGEQWGEIRTAPPAQMVEAMLDSNRRLGGSEDRIHYIATGLDAGVVYEMRVQLYDIVAGDASLWSNVIVFMTEVDQEDDRRDREIDDWLNYLRRRVEEFLRREFWLAHRTPYSTTVVVRPDDVFRGLMDGTTGTDIRLHNPGTDRVVYYIPTNAVFTANENRRGFSTAWDDIQFLFAPSFLTDVDNQAVIDMLRAIDVRGSDISDSFVRLEFNRIPIDEINGRPAITPRTQLTASMVGTNDTIRNIATWDRQMLRRATAIVEDWLTDAVMRENFRVQLIEELSNEDMSDHVYDFLERVLQDIIDATSEYMTMAYGGILYNRQDVIHDFDAAMHVIATPPRDTYSVFGYEFVNEAWRQQNLIEAHNGRSMIFRRPGIFAFTGREIIIPDIEITPRGDTVISIVARYGLEDLFGVYVDLEQFANRQMVIGSIARTAGVPVNANAMNWAVENLDVQLTSRNATGLISRQEAIAVTVALYAHRTNTPINTLRIHNHQNTAGMDLDARFANSVRVAFELGLISDTEMDPAGPITIGEFLDMLTLLNARVRV